MFSNHFGGLLLLTKNALEKVTKNLRRAPPPHLDKIQKNSYIFSGDLPLDCYDYWSSCGAKKQ